MLTVREHGGFTLVEVVVALVILSAAVLGLASSASRLTTAAASAEVRALAMEGLEDRLARVRLDPRYGGLDTLYASTESNLYGIPGMTRRTTVAHVKEGAPSHVDYKVVTVTVAAPMLEQSLSRRIVIAAP